MPAPVVAYAAKKATKAALKTKTGRWLLAAPVVLFVGLPLMLLLGISGAIAPAAAGSCGPGTAVPASADLPAPTIAAINALKPDYEAAAAAKNVSWAILAGIDWRESGSDPNRSSLAGEPLGSTNPDHPGVVMHTKAEALEATADYLRSLALDVYGVTVTSSTAGEDMTKALVAYGRGHLWANAGIDPDLSPYALNERDSAHQDMRWPDSPAEPLAGMVDTRWGAQTIFERLGGSVGACGLSDVDIVRIAQGEIGNAEDPPGSNDGGDIAKYRGSDPPEPWCADWVSWVYREAGHPFTGGAEGWRIANVAVMQSWLGTYGVWHNAGPGDDPRPGDVITFRDADHVGIVERLDGDTVWTIEGNSGDKVARRSYARSDPSVDGWGRMAAPA